MSRGWILDTGAIYYHQNRTEIVGLLPKIRAKNLRIVMPSHVLMELSRQQIRKRQKDALTYGSSISIDPQDVWDDLMAEMSGVECLSFSDDAAVALLKWLDTQVPLWEQVKLEKAVSDAWLPFREAVLDLNCPICNLFLRNCTCNPSHWTSLHNAALKQSAHNKCASPPKKARASSTIDWLTVAMAVRHDLIPVTNDKHGPEWQSLNWIVPTDLVVAVEGA